MNILLMMSTSERTLIDAIERDLPHAHVDWQVTRETTLGAVVRKNYDCIVLLDDTEPEFSGLVSTIKAGAPHTHVIVLDPEHNPELVRHQNLRDSGAHECVQSHSANYVLPKIMKYLDKTLTAQRELVQSRSSTQDFDHLTGVLNRTGLGERLGSMTLELPWSVILMDCDGLKDLNQRFGYAIGDLVLRHVAKTTSAQLPPDALFGRVGGDSFLVVLPAVDINNALPIAQKIRRSIRSHPIELSDGSNQATTVSLGIIQANSSVSTISELVALAQGPLAEAKAKGANALVSSAGSSMKHSDAERSALGRILEGVEPISMVCQPIVDVQSHTIYGYEMLCRGPKGGLSSPYQLFAAALAHNLLAALDISCVRAALEAARTLPSSSVININILPSTLLNTSTQRLAHMIRTHGIDPRRLCLELNEQQLTEDPVLLQRALKPLQEMGVRVALDDVGFGKTCLEHLLYLAPDYLKIDRSILIHATDSAEMLRKLVEIGRVLGADIIVEGVETEALKTRVQVCGAQFAQGFLWGQPEAPPTPAFL